MKFCKDCKHIRTSTTGLVPELCLSPNLPIDLVSGSPKFTLCKEMRYPPTFGLQAAVLPACCGEEGNWFEAIEDADLDDLSKIPFGR